MALRTNLFVVALALSLLGNVMVYSATSKEYGTHYLIVRFAHLVLGVLAFFVFKQVRYTSWRKFSPWVYLVVVVSLVLVLVPSLGTEVGGSRRWFDLGPMSIQPAEFAKLAAILLLSCAVARLPPGSGLPLKPPAAVGVLFVLVFVEPDFGTSVVLLSGVAGTLWASELRSRDLVLSGLVGLVAVAGMMMLEPYRRERFLTFRDPWAAADGSGYQVVQSMVAIKAGDRKSTRLNSSHANISYAVFCLKKKKQKTHYTPPCQHDSPHYILPLPHQFIQAIDQDTSRLRIYCHLPRPSPICHILHAVALHA